MRNQNRIRTRVILLAAVTIGLALLVVGNVSRSQAAPPQPQAASGSAKVMHTDEYQRSAKLDTYKVIADSGAGRMKMLKGQDGERTELRATVLKGRANYLCLRRWQTLLHAGDLTPSDRMLLIKTLFWLPHTVTGDRAELHLSPAEEPACCASPSAVLSPCCWPRSPPPTSTSSAPIPSARTPPKAVNR